MSIPNLILIGMPGAGKSTIGKLLANKLGMYFVDGDEYISQSEGMRPQQIINTHGEAYFLHLEQKLFMSRELFTDTPCIFAPGGSVVYHDDLMQHLRNQGTVIFLDVPFSEIERRITTARPRGIIGLKDKTLKDLSNERVPLYQKYADLIISCDGLSRDDITEHIAKKIDHINNSTAWSSA